jgi:poly-gamma-glutamate synthesis protein (capsule biosynthesis protein)
MIKATIGFIFLSVCAGLGCTVVESGEDQIMSFDTPVPDQGAKASKLITLFLCGDVMTGRGIDQVLPYPSDPTIYESYMRSALGYVELAEMVNGPIQKPVDFSYIWGDALEDLDKVDPDLKIINLETSITKSDDYWKGKGINYRMHPENTGCLTAARIDYCSLANNHILDWGFAGLQETLETLEKANIHYGDTFCQYKKNNLTHK